MIRPYVKPRPHRRLGWLLDHETVVVEGKHELPVHRWLADSLGAGVQVWAASEHLRELTRAGHGSAVLWRFAAIGWSPHRDAIDWPVRGLAVETPADPEETLAGLCAWRDWLESHGAAPAGSLGGSGLSLVKATLERPLWTNAGDSPPIRYTIGGRQETANPRPAHYRTPLAHSDIQAAYAQVLGAVRYGGCWQREPWKPLWGKVYDKNPGTLLYVRAIADVPELADHLPGLEPGHRGPLLARPRKTPDQAGLLFWNLAENYPAGRRIQGTWSWPELVAAEAAGTKIVRVLDAWLHIAVDKPFSRWIEAVHEGRDLGGFAGRLAKATGNATWGQFAIAKGKRRVVARGRQDDLPLRGGNPSQRAFDLAEQIAGRVRADLYRGMLEAGPRLVCAHTDGLWTSGPPIGGWRKIGTADELRLLDAQHYAHREGNEPWQYVVAGVLDPAEYFESRWSQLLAAGEPTPLEAEAGRTARASRARVAIVE